MTGPGLRGAVPRGSSRLPSAVLAALLALLVAVPLLLATASRHDALAAHTYTNPLTPAISGGGVVESCADPSVIRGQTAGDNYWYMYCTTDPLNGADQTGGAFNFRLVPMLRSLDLVNWEYMGDAFSSRPDWADPTAGLWAPEIDFLNGQYYLYYGVTNVADSVSPDPEPGCPGDNAIGVATSSSPLGPWTHHDTWVVPPRQGNAEPPEAPCEFAWFWTFDPEVITAAGVNYIYYGSYFGGIEVRILTPDGLSAPAPGTPITIANRYEGSEVVFHDGFWYLFVSATDCCRGPLTGYSVFAGRSVSPLGPFLDREGVSLLESRVGGTPVISLNGNRWVGPGHNTVFTDFGGQWWTIYHAIDRFDPYFTGAPGFDKRPAMLDPIDWVGGWPMVRGGHWASDGPMPAPAAQPDHGPSGYVPQVAAAEEPGALQPGFSDEFDGPLGAQWSWIREPPATEYGVESGTFRFNVQKADLFVDSNSAPILVEPAPTGDYIVETRVRLNVPADGCCHNFTQAGLVIYGGTTGTTGDDAYVKLVHASIWETRQTEWAKEWVPPFPTGGDARYGNTVVGPPHEWTFLRIVKRTIGDEEHYRAYTSRDANNDGVPDAWVRGGVWTHSLGGARIGLVSMGEPPDQQWVANFDYVRVYAIAGAGPPPPPPPPAPGPSPTTAGSPAPTTGTGPAATFRPRIPDTATSEPPRDLMPLAALLAGTSLGILTWMHVVPRWRKRRTRSHR